MGDYMNIENLSLNFDGYILNGDYYYNDTSNNYKVLLLHGGGLNTTKEKFHKLRLDLLEMGIDSYAFDFIGHGDNNEDLYKTSLHHKVLQAKKFIDKYITGNFSIISSSMSGYISIKLTQMYNINNLILFVPALYTKDVYDINFGMNFSNIIRKENSWENSDAFDISNKYKGNVLLITAENDDVIPKELTDKLIKSFNGNLLYKYEIKDGSHNVFSYIYESNEYNIILNKIASIIKSTN